MTKVYAKKMPNNVSDEQKGRRIDVCSDIMERIIEGSSFLKSVITIHEMETFEYDS